MLSHRSNAIILICKNQIVGRNYGFIAHFGTLQWFKKENLKWFKICHHQFSLLPSKTRHDVYKLFVFVLFIRTFLLTCIYFSLNLYDDVFGHGKSVQKKQKTAVWFHQKLPQKQHESRHLHWPQNKKDRGNIAQIYWSNLNFFPQWPSFAMICLIRLSTLLSGYFCFVFLISRSNFNLFWF